MLSKQIIVEIYNSEQKYWWILIEVLETNEIMWGGWAEKERK